MRLRRLVLSAFGPFSGHALDLSGGAPGGLHLIHGLNEAGKTTTLRAVRDLLYGIPHGTPDAHRHAGPQLSIEAEIEDERGQVLFVRRRKGLKGTLRDENDAPLDEAVLWRLLGGVDAASFARLFAFDHAGLKEAAEEMLAGKGDLGPLLFEAGSGLRGLHRLLQGLSGEASSIYRERGKRPPLNQLLDDHAATRRDLQTARESAEAYADQERARDELRRRLDALGAEQRELRTEQQKLSRIGRALSPAKRRQEILSRLDEIGPVPELAPDASDRRIRAEAERGEARRDLLHLERELDERAQRLAELGPPPALAELGPDAERELSKLASEVESAETELPEREAELSDLASEIEALGRRVGLSEAPASEAAGVTEEGVAELRALLMRWPVLEERRARLEQRRARARARLEELERRLLEAEDQTLEALELASDRARGAAELEARLTELAQDLAGHEVELGRARRRLSPEPAPERMLRDLPVPEDVALEEIERELEFSSAELRHAHERRDELGGRERALTLEIDRIKSEGPVPSHRELTQARAERDRLAQELLKLAAAGQPTPPAPVAELLARIGSADLLADRLRAEASRVTELASRQAELHGLQSELSHLVARLGKLEESVARQAERHRALWAPAGIEPRSPGEMRAFLSRLEGASRLEAEREAAQNRLVRAQAEARDTRSALLGALGLSDESEASLSELLAEVELGEKKARARRQHREDAEAGRIAELTEVAEVEQEMLQQESVETAFRQSLAEIGARLGLTGEQPAAELEKLLEPLASVATRVQRSLALRDGAALLKARAERLRGEVQRLVELYAPDLRGLSAERAARILSDRQREAMSIRLERERLLGETSATKERRALSEARIESAEAELCELSRVAKIAEPSELAECEEKVARAHGLRAELGQVEQELAATAPGRSLKEIATEALETDGDRLRARQDEVQSELEQLADELLSTRAQLDRVQVGLDERFGGSAAADAAQKLAQIGSEVRGLVTEYARLKLAERVLEREIERFREDNQGPILRRASELFTSLTLGKYTKLRPGLDEPVMECELADGGIKRVSELSEGARYQLYFALRVASLERYLEHNPAMPVLLDDVFIHFDDERPRPGFGVLSELSRRTQILFFTHHERLRELAREELPEGSVFFHELPSPAREAARLGPDQPDLGHL